MERRRSIEETISYTETSFKAKLIEKHVFEQTWGSTALGFNGCGGDAITTALTTVLKFKKENSERHIYAVCFGKGFCYYVENPNKQFFEDIKKHTMASENNFEKRYC